MLVVPLLLAALAAPAPSTPGTPATVPLTFGGKTTTADQLPSALSPEQRKAVERFLPFAVAEGYRMDFDGQGRLLLLTHKDRSGLSATRAVVGKAESWFDTALPPPTASAATGPAPEGGSPRPAAGPLPEDPESRSGIAPPAARAGSSSAWGSGSIVPDSQVAVLVIAKDADDYTALLDLVSREATYLKDWIEHARKFTGFTIEDPLAGAYVENAAGQEEWNGNHELSNRVVQLLTLRRFGQQPNWLVQGIAWECEMAGDGQVYCFPFRNEFVFAAEHGAWPNEVKLALKELARPLELADVTKWKRGAWDGKSARLAWGLSRHLLGQGGGKLSQALERLRLLRDQKNRRSTGVDSWERIAGFELSDLDQLAALTETFGAKVLGDATASMQSGRVVVKKDPPRKSVQKR